MFIFHWICYNYQDRPWIILFAYFRYTYPPILAGIFLSAIVLSVCHFSSSVLMVGTFWGAPMNIFTCDQTDCKVSFYDYITVKFWLTIDRMDICRAILALACKETAVWPWLILLLGFFLCFVVWKDLSLIKRPNPTYCKRKVLMEMSTDRGNGWKVISFSLHSW